MKYLFQFGIIMAVSFFGEVLHQFLPLPVPASVYGIIILFILLLTKIVKVEQVEETSGFFLSIMPILFLPPSVGIMDSVMILKGSVLSFLIMVVLSTLLVMGVTGKVAQSVIRSKKKKDEKELNEVTKIEMVLLEEESV